VNWIEVEARLPRRVAQKFEVEAGGSELGRARDVGTSGYPVSEKKKERVGENPPNADAFAARNHTRERKEEGKKGKEGEWVARALRLTRIVVVRSITGSRHAPPPARVVVAVLKSPAC